jgi:hypothetical protein
MAVRKRSIGPVRGVRRILYNTQSRARQCISPQLNVIFGFTYTDPLSAETYKEFGLDLKMEFRVLVSNPIVATRARALSVQLQVPKNHEPGRCTQPHTVAFVSAGNPAP